MSPRARVWIVVGVAALVAAGTAVGVTVATRSDVAETSSKPPPFAADPTASPALAQDVRDALKAWPAGTVRRLRILAARNSHSALVRLELGLALALSGQTDDAKQAWKDAARVQPDSPSAVRAQDLRHPGTAPGLPPFVPSFTQARTAAQTHLLRGAAFQQALRPVSARREFAAAARRGRRRALRQGSARAGVRAARPALTPFSSGPDRPLPPRTAPDLPRRPLPRPPTADSRPRRRAAHPPWKEG
jgi:hypothetical protein